MFRIGFTTKKRDTRTPFHEPFLLEVGIGQYRIGVDYGALFGTNADPQAPPLMGSKAKHPNIRANLVLVVEQAQTRLIAGYKILEYTF